MEVSLEDALGVFPEPNFLVISAAKANKTEAENQKRNLRLEGAIERLGYKAEPATGHYTYEDGTATYEDSFVVYDLPENLKYDLGRGFEQESILDEHGLHFPTKGTMAPFKESGHHIGETAKQQPSWLEYPLGKGAVAFAVDFAREH